MTLATIAIRAIADVVVQFLQQGQRAGLVAELALDFHGGARAMQAVGQPVAGGAELPGDRREENPLLVHASHHGMSRVAGKSVSSTVSLPIDDVIAATRHPVRFHGHPTPPRRSGRDRHSQT